VIGFDGKHGVGLTVWPSQLNFKGLALAQFLNYSADLPSTQQNLLA
jgi:hypothetical protein